MFKEKINIDNSKIRDVVEKMIELTINVKENSMIYSFISTIKLVDSFVEGLDKKIDQILILNSYIKLRG